MMQLASQVCVPLAARRNTLTGMIESMQRSAVPIGKKGRECFEAHDQIQRLG